jgi:hypothetical protein
MTDTFNRFDGVTGLCAPVERHRHTGRPILAEIASPPIRLAQRTGLCHLKNHEKPICKLKKDQLAAILPILAAEAAQSRYICRRCGRLARSKKWLCKPTPIDKIVSAENDAPTGVAD